MVTNLEVIMIKRFISYYAPHKKLFAMDMGASFLIALCDFYYPIASRQIINVEIPNKNLRMIFIFGVIMLVVYLAKMALAYFVQFYGHMMGVHMQSHMREDVFKKLQRLPFSYYDEHETGVIMSRIINDLMDVSELAHHGPEDIFISGVLLIGSCFYLGNINIILTLVIFCLIPVLIFFSLMMRKRLSSAFIESRVEVGNVNATLENSIGGIRVSKAFGTADHELDKFRKGNKKFVKARRRSYQAMGYFFAGTGFITDILNIVVLVLGGYLFAVGTIDIGDLVAFMLFINMFTTPIKKLINFMEQYQNGMSGFQRFCELIDEIEEPEIKNAVELDTVEGLVQFRHVNFSYESSEPILEDVSLDIKPGETVALVGPSGGGKTTICHLLPNFYPLDSGEITIDGIPIENISYQSLRENIGIVQQDVFLFTGTIRDNIAYGNVNASTEDIIEAAKKANIHEYVLSLPDGYDTEIGERGVRLSGGQKQRVSIARVFLKNPEILILDEATSALDNATEILIQGALEDLSKNRTTLVVAHRLSTIKNADRIVVITKGRIREQGTHDELMEINGIYNELYTSQFRVQED